MAATLASLVVRVGADVRGVTSGLNNLDRRMKRSAQVTRQLAQAYRAVLAGGAFHASRQIFELGASVEETGSKFRTVFGDSSGEMDQFLDRFGTLAGLTKTQAQGLTATTGAIVQGMGLAADESAAFSREVVKLSADLASFNNVPIAETSRAVNSALTGERESLKTFGVALKEADVQRQALAMSGKAMVSQLSEEDKALATLALITERAGVAIGDLDRTQDSAANKARQLGAEIGNLKESIAVSLLPAMDVGVTGLNSFIKGLQIMGAEAAVSVARMELAFAQMSQKDGGLLGLLGLGEGAGLFDPLGLDLFSRAVGADLGKTVEEAEANLARIAAAAEEVKLDIVGLTDALDGGGTTTPLNQRAQTLSERIAAINVPMRTFLGQASDWTRFSRIMAGNTEGAAQAFAGLHGEIKVTVFDVKALTEETNRAIDAQERLAAVISKYNAVSSLLGGVARIPGLGFLGGLTNVTGILGGVANPLTGVLSAFGTVTGKPSNSKAFGGPKAGLVAGTATSGSIVLDFSRFPPARDPRESARDGEWQRFLLDSLDVAKANGAMA